MKQNVLGVTVIEIERVEKGVQMSLRVGSICMFLHVLLLCYQESPTSRFAKSGNINEIKLIFKTVLSFNMIFKLDNQAQKYYFREEMSIIL